MTKLFKSVPALMVLAVLFATLQAGPAAGQEEMARFMNPFIGQMRFSAQVDGQFLVDQRVAEQNTEMGYSRQALSLIIPTWQNETNELALIFKYGQQNNDTRALLPDSGLPLPESLSELAFGAFYRHKSSNTWIWGGSLGVKSSSDKPFNSSDESAVSATAFARIPRGPRQAWMFFLAGSQSYGLTLNLPMPGFGWIYTPSPRLQMLLGLPALYLRYQPGPTWNFSAMFLMPRTFKLRAGRFLTDNVELFASLSGKHQSWCLADRVHSEDMLYLYENLGLLGVKYQAAQNVSVELSGGYAFDRMIFEGENFGDRHQNRLDIADGSVFQCQLEIGF